MTDADRIRSALHSDLESACEERELLKAKVAEYEALLVKMDNELASREIGGTFTLRELRQIVDVFAEAGRRLSSLNIGRKIEATIAGLKEVPPVSPVMYWRGQDQLWRITDLPDERLINIVRYLWRNNTAEDHPQFIALTAELETRGQNPGGPWRRWQEYLSRSDHNRREAAINIAQRTRRWTAAGFLEALHARDGE